MISIIRIVHVHTRTCQSVIKCQRLRPILTNALEPREEWSGLVQVSDEYIVANDDVGQCPCISVGEELYTVTMILIVVNVHAVHYEIVLNDSVILKHSEAITDEVVDHVVLVRSVGTHAAKTTPVKVSAFQFRYTRKLT